MSYIRRRLSDFIKIKNEEEIPGNFTSVRGEYMDPSTQKTGFYKLNASFWGEPDLRELLASIILKKVGVPCADIQLVYDDIEQNENGCLSMSILKHGEEFIDSEKFFEQDWYSGFNNDLPDFGKGIDRYLGLDIYTNKKMLPNLPQEFWNQRKDFLINYVFVSALLGNDDIKTDNCQIIHNSMDSSYRNPEYYDMGISFSGLSKGRSFYDGKSDKDVLLEIYEKYPDQVKDLSQTISKTLTIDYIKTVLDDEVFSTLSPEERKRIWSELGDKLVFINKANEQFYGNKIQPNGFNIDHEGLMEVSEKTPLTWKEKAAKFVTKLVELLKGSNENGRE